MIIFDVETTGLDPKLSSIVSIGAVNFKDASHTFYEECRVWKGAKIQEEALGVNGFSKEQATDQKKKDESELIKSFFDWIARENEKVIAGQNISFDQSFLKEASNRAGIEYPLARHIVDLHALSYADHLKKRTAIPEKNGKPNLTLDATLAYVGLPPESKPHIAINGAKLEAEAFSRIIFGKSLIKEYASYEIPSHFLVS